MGINHRHLTIYIIRPALAAVGLGSDAAEQLLLGTAIQESNCGEYLKQIGGGPALGIFQMEEATHDDIWCSFLSFKKDLFDKTCQAAGLVNFSFSPRLVDHKGLNPKLIKMLIYNLQYATIMARLQYYRVAEALPQAGDIWAMARYYKKYYNTPLGKATEEEFVDNWKRVVG